ncbi:MAG: winged helix-turn-helix domain-containing protein [Thermoplasmata archaeon]
MPAEQSLARPDVYVVVRLLDVLHASPQRLRRTQLQQRAGINYTLFARYLDFLVQRGFVAVGAENDGGWVEITARGEEAYRFLADGLARLLGGHPP